MIADCALTMRVTSPFGSSLRRMSVSISNVGVWNALSAMNSSPAFCRASGNGVNRGPG